MKSATEAFMRRRRNTWFAQLAIPKRFRSAYGNKAILEKSLKTDSMSEARIRRDAEVLRWRREFRELDRYHLYTPDQLKHIRETAYSDNPKIQGALEKMRLNRTSETMKWQEENAWRPDQDKLLRAFQWETIPDNELGKLLMANGIEPTKELYTAASNVIYEADRAAFDLFRSGRPIPSVSSLEPIDSLLEVFFAEKALRHRQQVFYRRVITTFIKWLTENDKTPVVGSVSAEVAGKYVSIRLAPGLRLAKSVNNEISALSSYWRFLVTKKGKATFNPFEGKAIERRHVKATSIQKRKFTNEEMIKLLNGNPSRLLNDCIQLLALHGMRAEELCQLRVGDCKNGVFRIYGGGDSNHIPNWHEGKLGKNESARRDIPVHSSALDIVRRRRFKKQEQNFLIGELNDPKWERSQVLGRDFRKYRKSVGIDDRVTGRRQSRVDLHSLRRWFISAAGDVLRTGPVGFTAWTIADVVGHDTSSMPLGMTMSLYPGTSDLDTKRNCIESVKLPVR